ncbi:MAG: hypothetical protein K0R52_1190 [Alphaproteobacteria bacterium]|nr:hypothetical protein [Alphaproteobacteria bacterium]
MTLPSKRTLMIALLMATSFSQGAYSMESHKEDSGYHSSIGKKSSVSTVTKTLVYGLALLSKPDLASAALTPTLGTEFQVNPTFGISSSVAAAGLNNGNVVLTWRDSTNNQVARIFTPNGTAITNEFNVSTTPITYISFPYIVGCNNYFAVTWGAGPILARIFSTNGTAATTPFIVNQTSYTSMGGPNVGCLTNGNFVFGWAVSSVGNYRIPGRIFSPTGTAVTSELNFNQITTNSQSNLFVLGLSNGDFFVNWYSPLSGNYRTVGRFFLSDGTPKGNEITINQNTTAPTGSSFSAQLTNGNIITIRPSGGSNLLGRIIQNEVPIGNEFPILNITAQVNYNGVAALTDGTALVAWDDGSGTSMGRFFSSNGTALTDQFSIPTTNEGGSTFVTRLANGGALVAWGDTNRFNNLYARTVTLVNTTSSPTSTTSPTLTPTTANPTSIPTSLSPTGTPNMMPTTANPTNIPTTLAPTGTPNMMPTSANPTSTPSLSPTGTPNTMPTTANPTRSPTRAPTTSSASRLTPGWINLLPTRFMSNMLGGALKMVDNLFK